jgi:hypothetical protein
MLSLDDVLNKLTFGPPTMKVHSYYSDRLSLSDAIQTKTYSGTGEKVEERLWLASIYASYDLHTRATRVNQESTRGRFADKLAQIVIRDVGHLISKKDTTLLYWCQRYVGSYYLLSHPDMMETLIGIYQHCCLPIAQEAIAAAEHGLGDTICVPSEKKPIFSVMMNAFKTKMIAKHHFYDETNPYQRRTRRRRRRW